jgi:hypothetical protein
VLKKIGSFLPYAAPRRQPDVFAHGRPMTGTGPSADQWKPVGRTLPLFTWSHDGATTMHPRPIGNAWLSPFDILTRRRPRRRGPINSQNPIPSSVRPGVAVWASEFSAAMTSLLPAWHHAELTRPAFRSRSG